MQKPIVAAIVVGALCAVIGYGIGRSTDQSAPPEAGTKTISESDYGELVSAREEAEERVAVLQDSAMKLQEESRDLAQELKELREANEAAEAEQKEPEQGLISTGALAFGEFGGLAAIRDANWTELGEAVQNINELVLPLLEEIEQGQTPSATTQQRIVKWNDKLVRFGLSIMEKIPTNAPMPVNGEFTHPISLINLMAVMLETAGVPLSDGQRNEMAVIGTRYDQDYALLAPEYDEGTWELSKVLDELSLKRDTMLEVEERLTPAQLDVVAIPQIQNRLRLDTLSPVNMVAMNVAVVPGLAGSTVISTVLPRISQNYGAESEQFSQHTDLWEDYSQAVAEVLEPVKAEMMMFVHLDDILIAGRAQEQLLADFVARGVFTDEQLEQVASTTVFFVPQMPISGGSSEENEPSDG